MTDSTENTSLKKEGLEDFSKPKDINAIDFDPKPTHIPSQEIVDKLNLLMAKKKEEQAERERLAHTPRQPFVREEPRVGRNDPCPCGSGKKYKKCCMNKE